MAGGVVVQLEAPTQDQAKMQVLIKEILPLMQAWWARSARSDAEPMQLGILPFLKQWAENYAKVLTARRDGRIVGFVLAFARQRIMFPGVIMYVEAVYADTPDAEKQLLIALEQMVCAEYKVPLVEAENG